MSQVMTVELPDELFATIKERAQDLGIAPVVLVNTVLKRHFVTNGAMPAQRKAFTRLEDAFGIVNCPEAVGAENELIDADLVRSYSNSG